MTNQNNTWLAEEDEWSGHGKAVIELDPVDAWYVERAAGARLEGLENRLFELEACNRCNVNGTEPPIEAEVDERDLDSRIVELSQEVASLQRFMRAIPHNGEWFTAYREPRAILLEVPEGVTDPHEIAALIPMDY